MAKYKFANQEQTAVNDIENGIYGIHPGVYLWMEVEEWVKKGNSIESFRTPKEQASEDARLLSTQTKDAERQEARAYAKLQAISNMSPTQVRAWVENNVNNLADAKDAIKTLAVAICILSRNL